MEIEGGRMRRRTTTKMRFRWWHCGQAAHHSRKDRKQSCLTHSHTKADIVWPQRCTHNASQTNIFLWIWIPRQSQGGSFFCQTTRVYPINSDSTRSSHHQHKTKCQHSPASLSSCSRLSQNTPVNSAHPSSAATPRDPLPSKLAFPRRQSDSEKWCRQWHRGRLPGLTLCYTCETRVV